MRIRASSLVGFAGSAIIAALFVMGGCESDSRPNLTSSEGGTSGDTGGTSSAGGTTAADPNAGGATTVVGGTSGDTGGVGTAGAAGAAAPTPYVCQKGAVTEPKLAPATNGTWGDPIGIVGGDFGYANGTEDKFVVDAAATAGLINLTGTIPIKSYKGYGLYLKDPEKCFDIASSQWITGIRVTIGGTLNGAKVNFQLQQNNNYPITTKDGKGACTGSWSSGCASNKTAYLTIAETLTAIDIPWTSLGSGSPDKVDLSDVIGIQLHVDCPSDATAECVVNLNIGEITLY